MINNNFLSDLNYHSVLENLPVALVITDLDDRILYVNNKGVELLGYEREELVGQVTADLLLPEETKHKLNEKLESRKAGISDSYILEHIRKNGTKFWGQVSGQPYYDQHGVVIGTMGTLQDISSHKQIEDDVKVASEELAASNREFKEFAYIISHDLKAPLRAISSLISWIASDYADKFDEEGKKQVDLVINRVNRLNNLFDGTLTYSRVINRREEVQVFDMQELVAEVMQSIKLNGHISIQIAESMPRIKGERQKIGMVVEQLITNAIDYMDKPQGHIQLGFEQNQDKWVFYVKDNGSGIEERHWERIFKIFQSLKSRDEKERVGVGLTLVKKIVEMHGGKVWLESTAGEGSTFYFSLPKFAV
ncbi:MAG: PAS domain S-box protein [Bacteroidota bacterium]